MNHTRSIRFLFSLRLVSAFVYPRISVAQELTVQELTVQELTVQELTVQKTLVGFNGPTKPRAEYFENADAVQKSWLARSLEASELQALLGDVDFKGQMLVATAIGQRETATGSLAINRVAVKGAVMTPAGSVSSGQNLLTVYATIGVMSGTCSEARHTSFPFVVSVVDRPEVLQPPVGYFHQNFPDGCKQIQSGQASE